MTLSPFFILPALRNSAFLHNGKPSAAGSGNPSSFCISPDPVPPAPPRDLLYLWVMENLRSGVKLRPKQQSAQEYYEKIRQQDPDARRHRLGSHSAPRNR